MVKVAVAGGSGGDNPDLEAEVGARAIRMDYTDPSSGQKTLEDYQIHTVISALSVQSEEHSNAQIGLIRAAAAASSVKRFAPSEFGIPYEAKHAAAFPPVAFKSAAVDELKKTDLEYTLFTNGFFMDYLGLPKVKSYLAPVVTVLDIQHKVAGIPGSGKTPVVFTTTKDVGRFVVASLGLEKWSERSIIVGDRKTWNEVLASTEKATGTKFQTSYDSVEKLQRGQITELPSHVHSYPFFPKEALQGMFALFGYWFENGEFNFPVTQGVYLNEKFPEIVPTSIDKIITEAWA
ncbi:hypothetical protein OIDMADRAFT_169818 [Oidiodendron maius Zn]|uniref:NmrA-like domain-containing protein n=1 Tax=Oidiodendron maius (strain Zn) TaxID=913774 RepID=A0A0C3GLP3_OIDMZ|nr:hypothetical protein OIDMADRAFT_169818 [Oidiodendron maius Zn]